MQLQKGVVKLLVLQSLVQALYVGEDTLPVGLLHHDHVFNVQ